MSGAKLLTAFHNLLHLSKQPAVAEAPNIADAKLPKVAETIKFDRIQSRPAIDASLLFKWRHALGMNKLSNLTDRELRRLSWEPEASLSLEYLAEIETRHVPASRAFLKGLIYSALTEWQEKKSSSVINFLKKLEITHRPSIYLKKVAPFILAEHGYVDAARALVSQRANLQQTLSEIFGISLSSTKYADVVLAAVIEVGYQKVLSADAQDREWFYSQILQHVNKAVLLNCLDKVVTMIDASQNEGAKEEFKRFILHHPNLGDPRLPGYEGNWPKDDPLTSKVIEWLSQSDIKFFFELFIEEQSDRQGRKQFWLQYAHLVKGTRVIVSNHDSRKLSRQIFEMKERIGTSNLFAELKETSEKSTAFLMDFGRLVVVEFSSYGHSCYFYASDSRFPYNQKNLFWNTTKFSKAVLKDTMHSTKFLSHREGWDSDFSNLLAQYGLRPKNDGGR